MQAGRQRAGIRPRPDYTRGSPPARFFVDLSSALDSPKATSHSRSQTTSKSEVRPTYATAMTSKAMSTPPLQALSRNKFTRRPTDHFRSEFIANLPEEDQRIRLDLGRSIVDLLGQCRACQTWDDRSEYKLPQWIEYVPEEMLAFTSLAKMVRIKCSLGEYLQLHKTGQRSSEPIPKDDFEEDWSRMNDLTSSRQRLAPTGKGRRTAFFPSYVPCGLNRFASAVGASATSAGAVICGGWLFAPFPLRCCRCCRARLAANRFGHGSQVEIP